MYKRQEPDSLQSMTGSLAGEKPVKVTVFSSFFRENPMADRASTVAVMSADQLRLETVPPPERAPQMRLRCPMLLEGTAVVLPCREEELIHTSIAIPPPP